MVLFLLLSFQDDTMHVQSWPVDDSTRVASIESATIMFIESPQKDVRLAGVVCFVFVIATWPI
jgi:hypothetical protein